MSDHCEHCLLGLNFGPRRHRILLLLSRHPELDDPAFRGTLDVQTDRNGQVRGAVRDTQPLPLIELEWRATLARSETAVRPAPPR